MTGRIVAQPFPSRIDTRHLISAYRSRTPRSERLHEQACRVMPGGDTRTATFFPPYPTFMDQATQCRMRDVDGNTYLDFLGNYTSLVHGHAHPLIMAEVSAQLSRGTVFGAPTQLQVDLATRLAARIPSIQQVRFTNSATEAVEMSIRAARAFTGRAKILKFEGAYHGSGTDTAVSVRCVDGQPLHAVLDGPGLPLRLLDDVLVAPFNDPERTAGILVRHADDIAAVIVEPVMNGGGMIPAQGEFLASIREVTAQLGIVLIADEVVTLRLAYGGLEESFGIAPDLTILGKLIGGGFPIGAYGGRADILAHFDPRRPDPIYHSGTFNGNAISMAAGVAALDLLSPPEIERINGLGQRLREQFTALLSELRVPFVVTGAGSLLQIHYGVDHVETYRDAVRGRRDIAGAVHLALMNHGIVSAPRGMFAVSTAMTDQALQLADAALRSAIRDVLA